jgi:hypothetical protein
MQVGAGWFLTANAHGADLMLIPVLLGIPTDAGRRGSRGLRGSASGFLRRVVSHLIWVPALLAPEAILIAPALL